MDTRQLRYFLFVAEELHFGRAAERLGIAQPPLSQQIKKLEQELGVKLFQRNSRRVELTDAGRSLLGEARLILERIEVAREVARQFSAGISGSLNLGAVSPALDTFLPVQIQHFVQTHPTIRISLHELRSDEQLEWLRTGRLDVGFLRIYEHDLHGLACRIVDRQSYILAIPASHPLAKQKLVPLRSLDGINLIMAPRRHRPLLHDRLLSTFQSAGASVNIVQEVSSKRTEIALVAAGIGLALVPEAYATVFRRQGVVYRRVRGNLPPIEMAAVWHPDRQTTLREHLLGQFTECPHDRRGQALRT